MEYQDGSFNDDITNIQRRLASQIREKYIDKLIVTKEELERLDSIFWRFKQKLPWYSAVCASVKRIIITDPNLVPTAAVGWINGQLCFTINRDWFFGLDLNQQMFIIAHETEHIVRNHIQTMADWPNLMKRLNFCMDALVNESLIKDTALVKEDAPDGVITFEIYTDVVKNHQPTDPAQRGMPWKDCSVHDFVFNFTAEQLLKYLPKKENDDDEQQTIEDLMKALGDEFFDDGSTPDELKEAIIENAINEATKTAGEAPGHLKPYLDKITDKTNRDWRQIVRGIGQSTKIAINKSWGHINKKFPWRRPGRYIFTRPAVCLVVDRSGSVGPAETIEFVKEMNGLVQWIDLDIIYVDAGWDPNNPETYVKGVSEMKMWEHFKDMGGGTDFNDVYDYLLGDGAGKYETVIFLTDGYLWGSPMIPGPLARHNVAILTPNHSEEYVKEAKSYGFTVCVIDDSAQRERQSIKDSSYV